MEVWELGSMGGGDNGRHKDSVWHKKRKDQGWNPWEHWHLKEKLENQGKRKNREN